jgi:hypothetical protein
MELTGNVGMVDHRPPIEELTVTPVIRAFVGSATARVMVNPDVPFVGEWCCMRMFVVAVLPVVMATLSKVKSIVSPADTPPIRSTSARSAVIERM